MYHCHKDIIKPTIQAPFTWMEVVIVVLVRCHQNLLLSIGCPRTIRNMITFAVRLEN